MKKIISEDQRRKRRILKKICCSIRLQITRRKKKITVQVELARKLKTKVRVTNFCVLFVCFSPHIAFVCRAL